MSGNWQVKYYESQAGKSPVYDFIEELPYKPKAKVYNTLELLEEFGLQVGRPHVKKLTGTDLWELRILGENNIRIFYVAVRDKTLLLLHGFKKKQQKTPRREIQTALDRLHDYQHLVK